MSVGQWLRSQQFQWSLYQSAWMVAILFLGTLSAYLGGLSSFNESAITFLVGLGPILKRLQEGQADAVRNDDGEVKDRDVSNGIEPNPNPSIYLQ